VLYAVQEPFHKALLTRQGCDWFLPNHDQLKLVRLAIGPGALVNRYTLFAKDLFKGMTSVAQLKSDRPEGLKRSHRSWV
jgi:hypothetical protein